jgi:hypothetical protein
LAFNDIGLAGWTPDSRNDKGKGFQLDFTVEDTGRPYDALVSDHNLSAAVDD